MKNSWFERVSARAREFLVIVLATIYLVTVFAAIIRLYLQHSFLVDVDCKESLAIILF